MKVLSCVLALLAVSLPFAVNATAQESARQSSVTVLPTKNIAETVAPRGYLLGPGDIIEIKVLGEPQFDGKYTVDEDGKILLAFVNKPIQAGCRSEREIRADVAASLTKYLKNPQFSLQVAEKHSRPPAVVYGEVRVAQRIDMQRRARLQEVLAFSGGATEKAGGIVEVWHTQPLQCSEPGEETESQPVVDNQNIPFQVFKLSDIAGGKADSNPFIRPGDVVVVQKAPPVFIVGEVRNLPQDGVPIQEGGLTLTEVVARAGGLTRDAKKKEVRIYRLKPGAKNGSDLKNREIIAKNLDLIKKGQQPDEILQPYDIVEVEKAPKSIAQTLLEIATGTVRNTANIIPTSIIR